MTDTPQYTPPDVWVWEKERQSQLALQQYQSPYRGRDA